VQGLGPGGYTQSLCQPESVAAGRQAWQRLLENPGPVVIGAVQGAACLAPAYESALRADAELRRHGVRDAAPITFITPEPFLGDLGIGGMEDSRSRLERAFASRDIAWINRAVVEGVDDAAVRVRRLDEQGTCVARYALRFRYALILPALRGILAIAGIEGLADERGFLIVDEHLRNPRYRNIYAAGVAVTGEASPHGGHKIPYMIDGMVETVVRNIRDQLDGHEPAARAAWSAAHLADLGAAGLAFIADAHAASEPRHGVAGGDWMQMPCCALCDAGQTARPIPLR
jgi:sulfide:quinone oxidoreductase